MKYTKYLFNLFVSAIAATAIGTAIFLIFLVNVAPANAAMPEFKTPKTKHQTSLLSSDARVTLYYSPAIVGNPPVDRFADMWEVVDEHFPTVARSDDTVVEIHFIPYKKFLKHVNRVIPGTKQMMDDGLTVVRAITYKKKGAEVPTVVIVSYQPINDRTFVHELLHHYLDKLTTDGALDNHFLINEYQTHMDSLLRFMLGKLY